MEGSSIETSTGRKEAAGSLHPLNEILIVGDEGLVIRIVHHILIHLVTVGEVGAHDGKRIIRIDETLSLSVEVVLHEVRVVHLRVNVGIVLIVLIVAGAEINSDNLEVVEVLQVGLGIEIITAGLPGHITNALVDGGSVLDDVHVGLESDTDRKEPLTLTWVHVESAVLALFILCIEELLTEVSPPNTDGGGGSSGGSHIAGSPYCPLGEIDLMECRPAKELVST